MELMTLDTVRLRKKVGSMKAPGRWGWGENGFGGESAWRFNASQNSRRALKRRTELPAPDLRAGSPDAFPQPSSFPRAERFPSWLFFCSRLSCPFPIPTSHLTFCVPKGLNEEAGLFLDALLNAVLAYTEVPQSGDGEAPELLGSLPVAEGHSWGVV